MSKTLGSVDEFHTFPGQVTVDDVGSSGQVRHESGSHHKTRLHLLSSRKTVGPSQLFDLTWSGFHVSHCGL